MQCDFFISKVKVNISSFVRIIHVGNVAIPNTTIFLIKNDAVCTEPTLITELIQDIRYNGRLDCLRKPLGPPNDRMETDEEKKRRLEAAWDTDCAFEADYDWLKPIKENYGLKTGLVDVYGKPVDNDFDDQADMCEIFRALIAGGIIEGAKLEELNESISDGIDCPGEGEEGQSEVCAVSGGSAAQKYAWNILLFGKSIMINEKPKWELDPKSKEKLNAKLNS